MMIITIISLIFISLIYQANQTQSLGLNISILGKKSISSMEIFKGFDKIEPILKYWTDDGQETFIDYQSIAIWMENSKGASKPDNIMNMIREYMKLSDDGGQTSSGPSIIDESTKDALRPLLYQLTLMPYPRKSCHMRDIEHVLKFYRNLFGLSGFGPNSKTKVKKQFKNVKAFLDQNIKLRIVGCLASFEQSDSKIRRSFSHILEPMRNEMDQAISKTQAFKELNDIDKQENLIKVAKSIENISDLDVYELDDDTKSDTSEYEMFVIEKFCETLVEDSASSLDLIVLARLYAPEKLKSLPDIEKPGYVKVLEYARICHNSVSNIEREVISPRFSIDRISPISSPRFSRASFDIRSQ